MHDKRGFRFRLMGYTWGISLIISVQGCQGAGGDATGLGLGPEQASLSDSDTSESRRILAGATESLLRGPTSSVYLFSDHQDNLTLSLTTASVLVGKRSFSGQGAVLEEEGHVDLHGFSGQRFDTSTGLWSYKWRSLDPVSGRWLSSDPLFHQVNAESVMTFGEAGTAYAFVANQFGNRVDPTGLVGDEQKLKGKTATAGKIQNQNKAAQKKEAGTAKGGVTGMLTRYSASIEKTQAADVTHAAAKATASAKRTELDTVDAGIGKNAITTKKGKDLRARRKILAKEVTVADNAASSADTAAKDARGQLIKIGDSLTKAGAGDQATAAWTTFRAAQDAGKTAEQKAD